MPTCINATISIIKICNIIFQKWGGGSKAVWNFSKKIIRSVTRTLPLLWMTSPLQSDKRLPEKKESSLTSMRTAWTLGLVLSSPHTFHIFNIPRILIKIQNISYTYQHHKQKMIKVVQLAFTHLCLLLFLLVLLCVHAVVCPNRILGPK